MSVIQYVLTIEAMSAHPAVQRVFMENPAWATQPLLRTGTDGPTCDAGFAREHFALASRDVPATTIKSQLISVTNAAKLLQEVVSGIDLAKAKARVSHAANAAKFVTNGLTGTERRIDLHTFNTWLFRQRALDLAAEDE